MWKVSYVADLPFEGQINARFTFKEDNNGNVIEHLADAIAFANTLAENKNHTNIRELSMFKNEKKFL
jgi:hypothetical protein